MTVADIRERRLLNQHLACPLFTNPVDIVYHMGAIQAQDYSGAKWAVAQRLQGATDALVEKAFTDGNIIGTHVRRPTWHFVHPKDIRWMLDLTSARVQATANSYHKQLQLDHKVFSTCEKAIANLLKGGKQLMREEVAEALKQAGIATNEQRFIHLMMQMELIGLVCSGGRQGKQFTYTLLDDRVPAIKTIDRQDALAALTERYFTSHGPATLQDYIWWSGLTITDAKAGFEMLKHKLLSETIDGNTHWFTERSGIHESKTAAAFLLPNYDEYTVSYKDRSAAIESSDINKADPRGTIFNHTILINGRICAIWKRIIGKNKVDIEIMPFKPLSKPNQSAVTLAAKRYVKFLEVKGLSIRM